MLALLLIVSLVGCLATYIVGKREGYQDGYRKGVDYATFNHNSEKLVALYESITADIERKEKDNGKQ
jgi:hypothetical protein